MELSPESVRVLDSHVKHSKYIQYNELELGGGELLLLLVVSVDDGDESEDDAEKPWDDGETVELMLVECGGWIDIVWASSRLAERDIYYDYNVEWLGGG